MNTFITKGGLRRISILYWMSLWNAFFSNVLTFLTYFPLMMLAQWKKSFSVSTTSFCALMHLYYQSIFRSQALK